MAPTDTNNTSGWSTRSTVPPGSSSARHKYDQGPGWQAAPSVETAQGFGLRDAGIADEVTVSRINSDMGKHGDTGRSELDALRALANEEADAAVLGTNTWEAIVRDELMPGAFEAFWESPTDTHRNFTTMPSLS